MDNSAIASYESSKIFLFFQKNYNIGKHDVPRFQKSGLSKSNRRSVINSM
jgi:hypothetical protein